MIRTAAHQAMTLGGLCCAALLFVVPRARAEDAPLSAGTQRTETLAAGARQSYRIALDAGQAVELTLRQREAGGLELAWDDASAKAALRTAAGREATLRLVLVAQARSARTVSVAAVDARQPAAYAIALGEPHAATNADRARASSVAALAAAEALRVRGEKTAMPRARALYEKAASAAIEAGDGCGARLALALRSEFEHGLVETAGQQVAAEAALAQACDSDVAEQAFAERLLGSAFINQGDFASGTRATERAVELFGRTGDTYQQGVALRNLGLAYAESGEIEKALATTRRALAAAERVGDGKLLALVRNDLAFMHNARGEFALAIDAYRKTLDALARDPFPMAEAVAWINLGIAYGQLGDADQALVAFDKGEAVSKTIDCWSCLGEIEVDRGDDLLDSGKPAEAEAAYRRALAIAKAHQLVRQRAEALRGLGRAAMAREDWTEARTLLEAAREELHRTNARVNESVVYAMLGDLETRLARYADARRAYAQALALAREAANVAWQAVAHASLARVAERTGDLDGAKTSIEEAIALIESERTRIAAPDLRTSYLGTKRAYYGLYVDILMQLDRRDPGAGHAGEALVVAERARARELQDQLAERAINVDKDVAPELLAAEDAAEDALHALAYRLSQAAKDDAARATLSAQIDDASRRLDEARGRIRAANPRYAELTHPALLGLEEIQKRLLDDDASVLEYWLDDERSWLWLVTRDAVQAFALPPRGAIEREAAALRVRLLAPATVASAVPIERRAAEDAKALDVVRASAAALAHDILPGAARGQLRRDIVVVADGDLQTLPFALLVPDAAQALAYLPSIGTLRGLRARERSRTSAKTLAVLADPVFRADDPRLGGRAAPEPDDAVLLRAASEAGIADLKRLPHTREEADAIAALANREASWIALDFAASRDAALAAPWQDYAVVHFATHALLNARHPELSGIVLSLYDDGGRAEDGFLRANDIYNLRMPADLVVLSVCDSAVGRSVGAEGPANLARAFFYAGAPRVVASLWPVDDRASVAFMRAFYRALLEGGARPQDALAAAQREMRANPRWQAPYYWSGYVLEGDWR